MGMGLLADGLYDTSLLTNSMLPTLCYVRSSVRDILYLASFGASFDGSITS